MRQGKQDSHVARLYMFGLSHLTSNEELLLCCFLCGQRAEEFTEKVKHEEDFTKKKLSEVFGQLDGGMLAHRCHELCQEI